MLLSLKKKEGERYEKNTDIGPVTYQKLFWLFMVGSLVGVPLEGVWCLLKYGHWETHVVTVWGPFCIIYGFGAAACYAGAVLMKNRNIFFRFLMFALIGDAVEMICGLFLEYSLNMYAWDYRNQLFNIRGYVSLLMTVIWGVLGIVFGFITPLLEKCFLKMKGRAWKNACAVLSVFMAFNFLVTAACFVRWKHRHFEIPMRNNRVTEWIDKNYNDEKMATRYCEWRFYE